jgi:hypothetical protein
MAKFLQQTLDEMSLKAKGEHHSANAKEFAHFFEKVILTRKFDNNFNNFSYFLRFENQDNKRQMKIL